MIGDRAKATIHTTVKPEGIAWIVKIRNVSVSHTHKRADTRLSFNPIKCVRAIAISTRLSHADFEGTIFFPYIVRAISKIPNSQQNCKKKY